MSKFVVYLRVSTDEQGKSGLGIEAQRASAAAHVASVGGTIVSELVEIESGTRNARPQLAKAMAFCRAYKARLLIARLDRLGRNAHFVIGLKEAGVDFQCCDNPHANKLTVGIMALVAEQEAEAISTRTKAALQAAKARGVVLGGNRNPEGHAASLSKATAARVEASREFGGAVMPLIEDARAAGAASLRQIAGALNAKGLQTPRGGSWTAAAVSRVLAQAA